IRHRPDTVRGGETAGRKGLLRTELLSAVHLTRRTPGRALEPFGSAALVRSVVVAGDRRSAGLGRAIVQELEKVARASRSGTLILLTQGATEFFAQPGYRIIERIGVPQDVRQSAEFRSLCPASATCMMKVLSGYG
ncbi:MAG TPA: hypothetical protein VGR86_06375, partial [Steroidobacteraceae bacterium]|nr:hypothetical protein [Steroidobacteraceae bacterium]